MPIRSSDSSSCTYSDLISERWLSHYPIVVLCSNVKKVANKRFVFARCMLINATGGIFLFVTTLINYSFWKKENEEGLELEISLEIDSVGVCWLNACFSFRIKSTATARDWLISKWLFCTAFLGSLAIFRAVRVIKRDYLDDNIRDDSGIKKEQLIKQNQSK